MVEFFQVFIPIGLFFFKKVLFKMEGLARKFLKERLGMDMLGSYKYLLQDLKAVENACAGPNAKACPPERMLEVLVNLHNFYPSLNSVLELECGSGFSVAAFLRYGYDAMGVGRESVKTASRNLERLGFEGCRAVQGDFLAKGYLDDSWDFDLFFVYQPARTALQTLEALSAMRAESRIALPHSLKLFCMHYPTFGVFPDAEKAAGYLRERGLAVDREGENSVYLGKV